MKALIGNVVLQKFFKGSLIPLLFLALAFACSFPLLHDLQSSCRGDWDYFSTHHEVISLTFFEYGQFPLWNPYDGGGISLIGSQQGGFPAPIFLINGLFGVFAGVKIAVWLYTALGLWGMWLLAGYLGLKGPARLAPPFIFIFSSTWAQHLTEGHIIWLPAAFLPWLFLVFLQGLKDKRWLVVAAIIESVMFYDGGALVLSFSILFITVYAICYSIEIRSWQPLLAYIVVNILAVALSAPRLLPTLELLGSDPRPISAGSPNSWDDILAYLVERNGFGNWEYAAYVGIVVVVLYILSFSLFKQRKSLVLASLFMLFLTFGNFSTFSPWTILHHLPLFSSYKLPTRAFIVFIFAMALLIGFFLQKIGSSDDRRVKFILWGIVLFIGADLFLLSHSIFASAAKPANFSTLRANFKVVEVKGELYRLSPAQTTGFGRSVASIHQPFRQIRIPDLERFVHGGWSNQYLPLLENKGVIDAYAPIKFEHYARAAADVDYQGEYYLSGEGDVKLRFWSPNKLVFHVSLPKAARLVINQNFSSGWRTSYGVLSSDKGLLSLNLPVGEHDVELWYLPNSFVIGAALFVVTALGIWVFIYKSRTIKT